MQTYFRLIIYAPHQLQVTQLPQLSWAPDSLPIVQSPNRTVTGMGTRCSLDPNRPAKLGNSAHTDLHQKWELQLLPNESTQ